MNIRTN